MLRLVSGEVHEWVIMMMVNTRKEQGRITARITRQAKSISLR